MSPIAKTAVEPTGHIGIVGVNTPLFEQLDQQLSTDFALTAPDKPEELVEHMLNGSAPLDAVVIGLGLEDSVRLAQRIHIHNKLIPVLILSPPSNSEALKRVLMFSPFLSSEISVWSTDDIDVLPAALHETVSRHRQRQAHCNTLQTAQIRLEMLPLQRPEATHYLDRLLDHAPVGVVTIDLHGNVLTVNRAAQNMLASADGQRILGQPVAGFFSRKEHARLDSLQRSYLEDDTRECRDVFELGTGQQTARYADVSVAALAYRTGQRGFMLILHDVTSRVEAEKERQRAEDSLRHHAVLLRRFHGITTSESLSLEEKIDEVLQLGCEQFGLSTGVLSRIDGNSLYVVRSVGSVAGYVAGSKHRLDHTFCGITLGQREPLELADASHGEWQDHPANDITGHQSYIGTCLEVDDDTRGTLCFFDSEPKDYSFASTDSELIKLMSRWVSSELQRERADALMRKLSGALERTADAIMITDRNRIIEYVNSAFEALTGYSKEEAIGKKSYFLRSDLHDDKFYDELWQVIGKGEVYRGTIVSRRKDGSHYYEQKTISPLRDRKGTITHVISAGHDITDLVEAEEKNRAHQAELTHVARLSTLGEMTSGLAHELNQPLCAIKTYAQTCQHILKTEDCSPDRVRYGLEKVVKQAELASEIFRRLRDFARKGEIRREPFNMADVVREVVGFVTAEAQQKLVKLHQNVSTKNSRVLGDSIQIEQVLLNLVRNALDAVGGLEEARRRICIDVSETHDGWVTAEIRDHGSGCPVDMQDRLFEPFVTSKPEGLGIGLSISQGIIDAHGGRLWLAESTAEGAVFRFTLPIESAS